MISKKFTPMRNGPTIKAWTRVVFLPNPSKHVGKSKIEKADDAFCELRL